MSLQESVFNSLGTKIIDEAVLSDDDLNYIGFKQFADEVRLGERANQFSEIISKIKAKGKEGENSYETVYHYAKITAKLGKNTTDPYKPFGYILAISNLTNTFHFKIKRDGTMFNYQADELFKIIYLMLPVKFGKSFDLLVERYRDLVVTGLKEGELKPKLFNLTPKSRTIDLVNYTTDRNQLLTIKATASYNLFSPSWHFEIYENRLDTVVGGSKLVGTWYTDNIAHLLFVQLSNRISNVLCSTLRL